MRHVQAPEECAQEPASIFLAGEISDTENWQVEVQVELPVTQGAGQTRPINGGLT